MTYYSSAPWVWPVPIQAPPLRHISTSHLRDSTEGLSALPGAPAQNKCHRSLFQLQVFVASSVLLQHFTHYAVEKLVSAGRFGWLQCFQEDSETYGSVLIIQRRLTRNPGDKQIVFFKKICLVQMMWSWKENRHKMSVSIANLSLKCR